MAIHVADAGIDIQYTPKVSRTFAWIVFALTFGLLLSDYMSRQVLNAVFPVLKAEWGLSDTQLGSLNSIVAARRTAHLPALAARRPLGRVRSIVLMAALWSLATAACAVAENYGQMFAARFFVGVGERLRQRRHRRHHRRLPPHLRSTLSGAFSPAAPSAPCSAWRWAASSAQARLALAFGAMALFGSPSSSFYALVVMRSASIRLARPPGQCGRQRPLPFAARTARRPLLLGFWSVAPTPAAACNCS